MAGPKLKHNGIRTPLSIDGWLESALPGERLEYWRGYLLGDAKRSSDIFIRSENGCLLTPPDQAKLDALAGHLRDLMCEGAVILVQKRHGPLDYSYMAVKAARPRPRPDPWRAPVIR